MENLFNVYNNDDTNKTACLERYTPDLMPNEQSMETYEAWKEGVWTSCSQTILNFQDEIAEWVMESDVAPKSSADITPEFLMATCLGPAKCNRVLSNQARKSPVTRIVDDEIRGRVTKQREIKAKALKDAEGDKLKAKKKARKKDKSARANTAKPKHDDL